LHGAKAKNTDDLDIYGVYLEPPEFVLGLEKRDFYVWSTAGDERRNGPDDIDVCLYSLRKWAGLAAKGNPTALHFLFSKNYASKPEPWNDVLKHRELFISRQASAQFRGFAEAQLRRLQGIGTGRKGQRHDLIGAHGYDIKAAMLGMLDPEKLEVTGQPFPVANGLFMSANTGMAAFSISSTL